MAGQSHPQVGQGLRPLPEGAGRHLSPFALRQLHGLGAALALSLALHGALFLFLAGDRPVQGPTPARLRIFLQASGSLPHATREAPTAPAAPLPLYHPSETLTRQPGIRRDIAGDLPIGPDEHASFDLILFISADGSVDRVEGETTQAPALGAILKERFRDARFTPGEIAGRPVASRILIRVEAGPD